MPNNPSREAFERWAKTNNFSLELTASKEYSKLDTAYAYWGWQAGAQAERERINAEHASKVPQVEMERLQSAVKVLRDRSAP
jgi:hypothetical protein